ncbi:MAG: hypothetical protein ACI8UC_001884, partial [Psychromonas sp.]
DFSIPQDIDKSTLLMIFCCFAIQMKTNTGSL